MPTPEDLEILTYLGNPFLNPRPSEVYIKANIAELSISCLSDEDVRIALCKKGIPVLRAGLTTADRLNYDLSRFGTYSWCTPKWLSKQYPT
jgi:hypothetical protein